MFFVLPSVPYDSLRVAHMDDHCAVHRWLNRFTSHDLDHRQRLTRIGSGNVSLRRHPFSNRIHIRTLHR